MYPDELTKLFWPIDDPCQATKFFHPIFDMMFLTRCTVIPGAEDWSDIQEYAEGDLDWLQDNKILLNGDPITRTI